MTRTTNSSLSSSFQALLDQQPAFPERHPREAPASAIHMSSSHCARIYLSDGDWKTTEEGI